MQSAFGNQEQHNEMPVNIDDLVDIRDVAIDTSLSKEERMKQFVEQIKNPYCYRCGDIIVRVSFSDTDTTLEDRLKQYLLSGGYSPAT